MTDARRAWPSVLLCAVLAVPGLSSCASETENYCETLKDNRADLAKLTEQTSKEGGNGSAALNKTVTLLSELSGEAPDAVDTEWETLVEALSGLATAIDASGAEPADFAKGDTPEGVTAGQLAAVQRAAEELRALPVRQASQSIEQHALGECKVDLSSELGGAGGTG